MDVKTAKRIDSLYRNINSFGALAVLSLIVPVFLLFVVPLSLAYLYLRAKLLRDIDAGKIVIDPAEPVGSGRTSELTTAQKVNFIREKTTRLWAPGIILIGVALLVFLLLLATNV